MTTSTPAMAGLTVSTTMMAPSVAMQGGSTLHTNMFSMVKTAFDVAVIRLVNVPGSRLKK